MSDFLGIGGISDQLQTINKGIQQVVTVLTSGATAAATSAAAAAASAAAAAASATAAASINVGALGGLGLSRTSGTVLGINAGAAADSTNAVIITLGTFSKSTAGTWVSGSGNNGMGAALTIAASTWYHAFAIINGGVADAYFDTSPSAANAPGGTTAFRRLGSFKTDGSSNILAFSQNADRFDWGTPIQELSAVPGVTTAVTQTLVGAPLGIQTQALLSGKITDPTNANPVVYVSSLAQTDVTPSSSALTAQTPGAAAANSLMTFYISVQTNTSQQIRFRTTSTTANILLITNGWVDTRGRG